MIYDTNTVRSIIGSGMSVLDGDHLQASARFWLLNLLPDQDNGGVVRFKCPMTGQYRFALSSYVDLCFEPQ